MTPVETADPTITSVADVTCLACGCFCDDLTVSSEGGLVTEVRSACPIGREWFEARGGDGPDLAASIEGRVAEPDEAIRRAVSLLSDANAPVVWGLTGSTTEAARAAIGLADRIGARVVLDRSAGELGRVFALQDFGRVSATLGEVKNRADVVVFWGVDPVSTHPRHWERYSVEPRGRFVPDGRRGRTVIVIDSEPTASAARADLFVRVPPGRQIEALSILRGLIHGKTFDGVGAFGLDTSALGVVAWRLKSARYGALFFRATADARFAWEGAARLVRGLNEFTRCVLLGMGSPGNLGGADAALTWQGGYLQGVDFRLGRPTPLDDSGTLEEILRTGEAEAILAVSGRWPPDLSADALRHARGVPIVVVGPGATEISGTSVALATSTTGFDVKGTVVRSDGVVLPLRPVKAARLPSESDLIGRIDDGIRLDRARTP